MSDIFDIWDRMAAATVEIHRRGRMRELERKIAKTACGDCRLWMHSRECPREKNVNGYTRGPSMNADICELFVVGIGTEMLREQWRSELENLKDEVQP